jgi:acyl-CoA oxidase
LAASYCFFFTGKKVLTQIRELERRFLANEWVAKKEVTDIHASSSGLKSFTTTVAADGMEDCRKACGGAGLLECSGLPQLFTTYLQNPTVEEDNHMLPQQVVKVLLKLYKTRMISVNTRVLIPAKLFRRSN